MKTVTILALTGMLILFAMYGLGSCRAESPALSVSWQNDTQAQETERLRISEIQRTERARIEAEHGWRPWATLVALTVIGAASFIGYHWSRRPAAPQVTVNVFAPPPQIAAWLVQNPDWYFDGEQLVNPARRELMDVSSIPTARRITG